jgi:thioredoxin-like negative regulator of GroEL
MQAVRFIKIAAVALVAVAASAGAGWAFEEKPFEAASFEAAQAAGKPILIDVFAPWCPTCKAQQQVLGALKANPKYDGLTLFKVDFDNQPDVLKNFKVRQQSTLIAFKGATETARSTGDTQAASIEALINTTLQ